MTTFKISEANSTIFSINTLSDELKKDMKEKRTWTEKCPVGLERFRIIKFSYYDFEAAPHNTGEIMVLDAVAESVLDIFKELYELKFPIAKAKLIEEYNGDDEASMIDNNSSSFNCREITGGGLPSLHSYGLAIDINPVQNPYIGFNEEQKFVKVMPNSGLNYLNRTNLRPGMVENSKVVEIFNKHGFGIWGGKWNSPIDWQHFQPSRAVAQLLAAMNAKDAKLFFLMYKQTTKLLNAIDPYNNKFISLYNIAPHKFIKLLQDQPNILTMEPEAAYLFIKNAIAI